MASKSIPQKKLTGLELAQAALAAIPHDRTGTSLKLHIDEAWTAFTDPNERADFFATIQYALAGKLPPEDPRKYDTLLERFDEILSKLCAIDGVLDLLNSHLDSSADEGTQIALQVIGEKADEARELLEAGWPPSGAVAPTGDANTVEILEVKGAHHG